MPDALTVSEFATKLGMPLTDWQRHIADGLVATPPSARMSLVKYHGDPTLGGDGLCLPVDADCPACGWPERTFDTRTRHFGCIKCTYTSDERNA